MTESCPPTAWMRGTSSPRQTRQAHNDNFSTEAVSAAPPPAPPADLPKVGLLRLCLLFLLSTRQASHRHPCPSSGNLEPDRRRSPSAQRCRVASAAAPRRLPGDVAKDGVSDGVRSTESTPGKRHVREACFSHGILVRLVLVELSSAECCAAVLTGSAGLWRHHSHIQRRQTARNGCRGQYVRRAERWVGFKQVKRLAFGNGVGRKTRFVEDVADAVVALAALAFRATKCMGST